MSAVDLNTRLFDRRITQKDAIIITIERSHPLAPKKTKRNQQKKESIPCEDHVEPAKQLRDIERPHI